MRSQAALHTDFEALCLRRPFEPLPRLGDEGLMLGRGTLLARCARLGLGPDLGNRDAERLIALLSIVYGQPVDASVLKHVARAVARWHSGERAMAQLELAFARLPLLQSDADAFRLFVTDALLGDGMVPDALLRALGFAIDLEKYNRNQPRVPKGNGRASGEFGSGAGSMATEARVPVPAVAATAARGASFLGELAPGVLANLTRFALVFSRATAVLGALFIPTPNSGGVTEGVLPDAPGVRFRRDGPAGTLRLTATGADGSDVIVGAQSRHGVYFDVATGEPIGRDLGERLYLDADAVDAALSTALDVRGETDPGAFFKPRDDRPKLCPDPTPDVKHYSSERAHDYEDDVHRRVNPDDPIPRGFAIQVVDPLTGRIVHPDDCFQKGGDRIDRNMKAGDLASAKGLRMEYTLTNDYYGKKATRELVEQTKKYARAAAVYGGNVKVYFAEAGAERKARQAFDDEPQLKDVKTSVRPASKR